MIIFDDDVDIGQMLFHRGFEIAKPDGLQAHVGIVKVLDRRLDEQNFHRAQKYSSSADRKETSLLEKTTSRQ